MTYREKLEELPKDLNELVNDRLLFCDRDLPIDGFLTTIKEEGDIMEVILEFKDKDISNICNKFTYTGVLDDEKEYCFKKAYKEILLYAFLAIDSIGVGMTDGTTVNIFQFRTLITEGLKQLKNK